MIEIPSLICIDDPDGKIFIFKNKKFYLLKTLIDALKEEGLDENTAIEIIAQAQKNKSNETIHTD